MLLINYEREMSSWFFFLFPECLLGLLMTRRGFKYRNSPLQVSYQWVCEFLSFIETRSFMCVTVLLYHMRPVHLLYVRFVVVCYSDEF